MQFTRCSGRVPRATYTEYCAKPPSTNYGRSFVHYIFFDLDHLYQLAFNRAPRLQNNDRDYVGPAIPWARRIFQVAAERIKSIDSHKNSRAAHVLTQAAAMTNRQIARAFQDHGASHRSKATPRRKSGGRRRTSDTHRRDEAISEKDVTEGVYRRMRQFARLSRTPEPPVRK